MSLLGFVVAPPAMLVLRKLVKRIKGLAHNQFTGTADILETMQESLQGIRTVKAFTLEQTMRERIDASIAAVERNANKMARVSNRSSPLMETLGGFAVAGGLMYGGYSVVAMGATPGQFFSFLTAFLLAYRAGQAAGAAQHRAQQQPGRRAQAAGDRRQPGQRARRRRQAGAEADRCAGRVSRRHVRLPSGRAGAQPHEFCRRARQDHRAGRPLRRRQVHRAGAAAAALRSERRRHPDRRTGDFRRVAQIAAPADRLCRAGRLSVPRHHRRQHRLRQGRRHAGRDRGRRQGRLRARVHHGLSARLRHARSASTARNCPAASASASRWPAR